MAQYDSAPDLSIDPDGSYSATLHTTLGDIEIAFDASNAPNTVNNFVFLAGDGFYDGVIFHRIVPGFVIQGGDPTGSGRGGPGYRFRDELDGPGAYRRGTVAMANAGPNTNGSQFFVCLKDLPGLPHAYTIFGAVTDGLDVVDAIAALSTDSMDRPHDPPTITSVTVSGGE